MGFGKLSDPLHLALGKVHLEKLFEWVDFALGKVHLGRAFEGVQLMQVR